MSSSAVGEVLSSYRDYEAEAMELVKGVIQNAVNIVKSELREQQLSEHPIDWPCGRDFTVDKGKEAIQQLIKVKN